MAELIQQATRQTQTLVRDEIRLAQLELTEKGKKAGLGAGMFGGAGGLAIYGIGALVAGLILLLATAVDAWAAAFIVSAALFAIAGILALSGKKQIDAGHAPATRGGGRKRPARHRRSERKGIQVTPPNRRPRRRRTRRTRPRSCGRKSTETREELGDTVEQLAQKADVKGQAQAKVDETKQQAQASVDAVKENPAPLAAIGAGVAALLLLLWLRRR